MVTWIVLDSPESRRSTTLIVIFARKIGELEDLLLIKTIHVLLAEIVECVQNVRI